MSASSPQPADDDVAVFVSSENGIEEVIRAAPRADAVNCAPRVARFRVAEIVAEPDVLRAARNRRGRAPTRDLAAAIVAPNYAPAFAPPAASPAPRGDFNGDGPVDLVDVAILARHYGMAVDAAFADGDLDRDGAVTLADLAGIALGPGPFEITAPPATTDDTTPDLVWNASAGAVAYDVAIETAEGCTGEHVVQNFAGVVATSVTLDTLAVAQYFACVTARDVFGNGSSAANNGLAFAVTPPLHPSLDVSIVATVATNPSSPIVSSAGTLVNYDYRIVNTGDAPLTNVALSDSRNLTLLRGADSPGDGDDVLEVGETWRYTAQYTVTQADVDAYASIVNVATANSDQTEPDMAETRVVISALTGDLVGDVVIHPINHASFVMSWLGKIIYVDPVGGASPYAGLPIADLILVTHAHSDHASSSTIGAVGNTNQADAIKDVRIVAPQPVYNLLSTAQRNLTTVLANNASTNVLGINVAAVPAYNTNHPRGEGNGYVVTLGEYRIYISGDTGPAAEIRALDDIDAAFVCMNVPYTMTVDEAASVVRDIRPGVVYPYHYRNANQTLADLNRFSTLVGNDLGIEVRLRNWYA